MLALMCKRSCLCAACKMLLFSKVSGQDGAQAYQELSRGDADAAAEIEKRSRTQACQDCLIGPVWAHVCSIIL